MDVIQCVRRAGRADGEKPLEAVLRVPGFLLRAAKSCLEVLEGL